VDFLDLGRALIGDPSGLEDRSQLKWLQQSPPTEEIAMTPFLGKRWIMTRSMCFAPMGTTAVASARPSALRFIAKRSGAARAMARHRMNAGVGILLLAVSLSTWAADFPKQASFSATHTVTATSPAAFDLGGGKWAAIFDARVISTNDAGTGMFHDLAGHCI